MNIYLYGENREIKIKNSNLKLTVDDYAFSHAINVNLLNRRYD